MIRFLPLVHASKVLAFIAAGVFFSVSSWLGVLVLLDLLFAVFGYPLSVLPALARLAA
jgi:hypothetical protein